MVKFTMFIFKPLRFLREGAHEQVHSGKIESSKYGNSDYHKGVGNCENV
jgi:hypothetical protein